MSANLDLVRSIYGDWERGDFSSADWADPEIEYLFPDGPEPASGTGLPGLATAWRARQSPWADLRLEAEDVRELDDERVFALTRRAGRGRTSGLDIAQITEGGANLFHIRDGRVTRFVAYFDRKRALADLGLEA